VEPSYKRGFAMQATLAVVAAALGILACLADPDWRWLKVGQAFANRTLVAGFRQEPPFVPARAGGACCGSG
jgi:hypothetical protein